MGKKIFRSVFRYKLTAIFFILGQLLVYFTIFGALNIYNKAFQKEEDRVRFQYSNRISLEITDNSKKDVITNCSEGVADGNVILAGKTNVFFEEKKSSNRIEIILKQNEDINYELVEGRLPGSRYDDIDKKIVALGRYQYKYAYEEDGKKYVTFDGEKYEVVGVIGNKDSDYLDYKIVFYIGSIGDNMLKNIREQYAYTIEIGSNSKDINNSYKIIYKNIMKESRYALIESKSEKGEGASTINSTLYKEKFSVNILVYIFCLLNCMLISEFLIIQRKKEIAIRSTYGFSNIRILIKITGDVSVLCLTSFVVFIAIYMFLKIVKHNFLTISFNKLTLITVLLINVISIVLTIVYPAFIVSKIQPAVALKDIE